MTTLALAGLAAVPLVAVALSLAAGGEGSFTHLLSTILPRYALNTFALMALTGAFAGVVGVATAWTVTASDFAGRRVWSSLLVLPLAAPAYIVAYLYTDVLAYAGPVQSGLRDLFGLRGGEYWFPPVRTLPGAALMLGLVLYPYVYLMARASFAAQSRSQFLAARSLGLSPGVAFFRVALPGARPAIAGGLALVLMETLADFGVADYFAIPTFSTGIFRTWFALGDRGAAMKLAGVMLLVVAGLVLLEGLTRRGRVAPGDRLSDERPPFRLSARATIGATLLCGLPVLFGFVVPVGLLLRNVMATGDGQAASILAGYAGNSIGAAVVTAALATTFAVLLVYTARRTREESLGGRAMRGSIRIATLGYALPGTLLAVGLLAPIGGADRALTRFLADTVGWNGGLILTGTIALLVYALTVRFLTVSYNSVAGGMAKIPPQMDAAARSLGAGPLVLLRRVHLPLLAPQLTVSACLVFVDVMRELPATLILRPFDFETLATRVYRLASDERIAEASTAALLIVVVGLLPVILLNHTPRRR